MTPNSTYKDNLKISDLLGVEPETASGRATAANENINIKSYVL